jgi:hypothetical protein
MAKLNDFIDENQTEINTFFEQCAVRACWHFDTWCREQFLIVSLLGPPRRCLRVRFETCWYTSSHPIGLHGRDPSSDPLLDDET